MFVCVRVDVCVFTCVPAQSSQVGSSRVTEPLLVICVYLRELSPSASNSGEEEADVLCCQTPLPPPNCTLVLQKHFRVCVCVCVHF